MSTAIISRDDAKLAISFTAEAQQLKSTALGMSALIAKVTNAEENQIAVAAQSTLSSLVRIVDKARAEVKAPVLDFGRKIDASAKLFLVELVDELTRISELVGSFAALEQAKVRAAEAARKCEEQALEKQRYEALVKANSHDARDAVNEHFDRKAAELPVVQATRAQGQIIKQDWTIEVTDKYLLAKCHPTCVNIEPRLSDIKELLKLGVEVKGIKATPALNASVRAHTSKAIVLT